MAGNIQKLRQQAVLLRGDAVGVTTESKPRKIQHKKRSVDGKNGVFYSSLDPRWLRQLNLRDQGKQTLHSLSMGRRPVLVQHPAIIIQPAELIREVNGTDG